MTITTNLQIKLINDNSATIHFSRRRLHHMKRAMHHSKFAQYRTFDAMRDFVNNGVITGPRGPKGTMGDPGAKGGVGPIGDKGHKGAKGVPGESVVGDKGNSFFGKGNQLNHQLSRLQMMRSNHWCSSATRATRDRRDPKAKPFLSKDQPAMRVSCPCSFQTRNYAIN